jgi:hypothetical protein
LEALDTATELFHLSSTMPSAVLRRAADGIATAVPGCGGATLSIFRDRRPVVITATHSELAELIEWQIAHGSGPTLSALEHRREARITDTLAESAWPLYAARAAARAIRCTHTIVLRDGDRSITGTQYSLRPNGISPDDGQYAETVAYCALAALRSFDELEDARTTVRQTRDMLAGRLEIEQAKGMLMQATGCDADTAFGELARASQADHRKVSEVARLLIQGRAPASRRRTGPGGPGAARP